MRVLEVEEILPKNITYYRPSYRIDAKVNGKRLYLSIPAYDISRRRAERELVKIMSDKIDFILDKAPIKKDSSRNRRRR